MLTSHEDFTYGKSEVRYRTKGASNFGSWIVYEPSAFAKLDSLRKLSVSSPGFKQMKRSRLPLNEFSYEFRKAHCEPTEASYSYFFNDGETSSQEWKGSSLVLDSFPFITDNHRPDMASVDFRAQMKLFENLDQTKGSALVTLAEIDKTAQMIASTAKKLADVYVRIRKGDLAGAASSLYPHVSKRKLKALRAEGRAQRALPAADARKNAASAWLGFTYGWKPLVSDIYTQMENLANYLTNHQGVVRTARGSAYEVKTFSGLVTNYAEGTWNVHNDIKCYARRSYVCYFTLAEGGDSFANVFGLKNPAIVAWELMPFSFVVDWFLPVGNFLQSFSATNGLVFHSGVSTTKRAEAAISSIHKHPKTFRDVGYVREFNFKGGKGTDIQYYKYRNVLHDFPSPRLPTFKNPVSISHAISALALLQAVMGGKPMRPSTSTYRL